MWVYISWTIWDVWGNAYIIKKLQHLNTDLDVDYHGNSRSFEAFGSALKINNEPLDN